MMFDRHYLTRVGVVAALCLSGCVNATSVTRGEMKAQSGSNLSTYDGALTYGRNLTNEYLNLSSRGSYVSDGVFVVLLGLAASTAFQTVKGASATDLSRLGIAGVTLNEGAKYAANGSAITAVLDAAEQSNCIVREGADKQLLLRSSSLSADAAKVMTDGYADMRVSLRKKLVREVPDYAALATSLAGAIVSQEDLDKLRGTGNESFRGGPTADEIKALAEMRVKVAECVLKSAK